MHFCPSAATLVRLATDSIDGPSFAGIEAHIDDCDQCQARLERLRRNDEGVEGAESSLPSADDPPRIRGFAIEAELGRGGMGVVYQAYQPNLNRRVALKVLRSGPGAGSRDQARWLREARAFARVRHDNVLRIYQVGEADGWLYLVLELVPAGTLQDRLDEPYTPRDAARLVEAVAGAVAAIHAAGLLHLDLKPSNILLDAAPGSPRELATPRVADFGIAFRWNDPDESMPTDSLAGPVGTPSYMAPEQVTADRSTIGPAADIYGLGALLYHLLTGRRPFAAATVIDTLEQVRHQEPVPPRRLNAKIPRDLETICLKCLQKEPCRRYASADALADDVRRWLDGRPIAIRPVSLIEKTGRWCRRRPVVAGLASTLALTIAAGFLGIFLLWRHAEAQRHRAEFERTQAGAAQARAEADFRRLAELLNQMVELHVGGPHHLPKSVGPEHTIALLRRMRRHLLDMAPRLPDRATAIVQLAAVEDGLDATLTEQSRWDELRSLLDESLRESEVSVTQDPRSIPAWRWQAYLCSRLAGLDEQQGRPAEGEPHLRRAIECVEALARIEPRGDSIVLSILNRRALARFLALQGRHPEARDLVLANYRALEELPPERIDENLVAERVLNRLNFSHLGVGPPPPPRTDEAGHPEPMATLGSPEADRLPAATWADLVIRALRGEGIGSATIRETRAAVWFTHQLMVMASDQRQWGRLDQARQTADRFVCLARRLVERNPDHADAHLVLANAFDQLYKNAWHPIDRPELERSLRQAIAANQRALEIAPHDEVARHDMERRRRKLDGLLHPG